MKSESKTTVITGQKVCHLVGIITIVASVVIVIFDWFNGEIEWDYALTAGAFGLMCLYASKLLKNKNEK